MEEARLIHSALCHQKMQMRVEIDPVAKCLNGRDYPGHELSPHSSILSA